MLELEPHANGIVVPVRVHARARRNGILGEREGMLRVAVTAAPEKGKANEAVIDVVRQALRLPKSAISIISGETSTRKRLLVAGVTAEHVRSQLATVAGR
jgi:uncharacterized protein (TIGR00251 family)